MTVNMLWPHLTLRAHAYKLSSMNQPLIAILAPHLRARDAGPR